MRVNLLFYLNPFAVLDCSVTMESNACRKMKYLQEKNTTKIIVRILHRYISGTVFAEKSEHPKLGLG